MAGGDINYMTRQKKKKKRKDSVAFCIQTCGEVSLFQTNYDDNHIKNIFLSKCTNSIYYFF